MIRWVALVALLLAACDNRVDPPPVPVHKPSVPASPEPAPAVVPPAPPVVEAPVAPAPKAPDPAPLLKLAEEILSGDGTARREAAGRLSALGADAAPALPTLMKNLREGDPETKKLTTGVLLAIGSPAVPSLVEMLKERVLAFRIAAIEALRELGPKAEAAAPELIAGMGSVDGYTTQLRIRALVSIGRPAVPALIEVLNRDPIPKGHERMFQERTRQDIFLVLMQMGPIAEEALPILKEAAEKDPQSWEGRTYARIRAGTTPVSESAAELSHQDPKVRARAAEAIRLLGPAGKEAVPALIDALKRQDDSNAIQRALRAVGPDAILPLIGVMESSQDERVLYQASDILQSQVLPAEAVPRLAALVLVPDGLRVEPSIRLLEKMGPKAASAIPTLAPLLKSPRDSTRGAVYRFLGRTGSPEAAVVLTPLLKDHDLRARLGALETLKQLGPAAQPAKDALSGLLKDENPRIRSLAEGILKELGGAK